MPDADPAGGLQRIAQGKAHATGAPQGALEREASQIARHERPGLSLSGTAGSWGGCASGSYANHK